MENGNYLIEKYRSCRPNLVRSFCNVRSAGYYRIGPDFHDRIMKKDFLELYWCVSGQGYFLLNGNKMKMSQGEVFCYFPGDTHRVFSEKSSWEYYWITIDGPDLPELIRTFDLKQEIRFAGTCPTGEFREIIRSLGEVDAGGMLSASILAYSVLSRAANPVFAVSDDIVEKYKQMVRESYSDPDFTVESASSALLVHRSTLHRIFSARCGVCPLDYLRSFRLQKAVEMLGRDISVKEVAAACGFRESNYFIRVFRSCFEKTPLEFRKTLPTHYSALEMEE
ncbi:MAG: AraC family transcriptional regulator [Lentisphaeria bacterium]|nr:AraC family transcriptional regulator [Lentisphaeria bacterium]